MEDKLKNYESIIAEAKKTFQDISPFFKWDRELKKDDVETYLSQDDKNIRMSKGEAVISRNIDKLLSVITDPVIRLKWAGHLATSELIEDCGDFKVFRTVEKKKKASMVAPREKVYVTKTLTLDDGSKVVLGRSVEHESCPEKKKESVRAFVHLIAWVLVPDKKDPEKIKVSYILYVDPKGKIPKALYKSNVIEQAHYIRKFKKFVESQHDL